MRGAWRLWYRRYFHYINRGQGTSCSVVSVLPHWYCQMMFVVLEWLHLLQALQHIGWCYTVCLHPTVQCHSIKVIQCAHISGSVHSAQILYPWGSYQIRKIAGCVCAGNAGNVFPRRRFQKKPLVSDSGMHHGTCVTHVPWCMSGSLTCCDGENVPGIPGACAPAILRIWQEAHSVHPLPDHQITGVSHKTITTSYTLYIQSS